MNPRQYPRKTCPGCGRDETAYYPETGAMVFHKCSGARQVNKADTSKLECVEVEIIIRAMREAIRVPLDVARTIHRDLSAILSVLDGGE